MALKRLAKTKNGYQSMLHTYIQRRSEYKKRPNESDEKFKKRKHKLKVKIGTFQKAIKRIEQREKQMDEIANLIQRFMGVKLKLIGRFGGKNEVLAKNIFYKYSLQNSGLRGSDLAWYIGIKTKDQPNTQRMVFTRSFNTNKENKEAYHRFIEFTKRKDLSEF